MGCAGVPAPTWPLGWEGLDDELGEVGKDAPGAGSGLGAALAEPGAGCGDGLGLGLLPAARARAGPDRTLSKSARVIAPPSLVRRGAAERRARRLPDPPCRRRHSKCRARNSLSIISATGCHDTPTEEWYQPFPAMQRFCPPFRRPRQGRIIGSNVRDEPVVEPSISDRPRRPAQAGDRIRQRRDRECQLAGEVLIICGTCSGELQGHESGAARLECRLDVFPTLRLCNIVHGSSTCVDAARRVDVGSRPQAAPRSRVARSRGGPGAGTPAARPRLRAGSRRARSSVLLGCITTCALVLSISPTVARSIRDRPGSRWYRGGIANRCGVRTI